MIAIQRGDDGEIYWYNLKMRKYKLISYDNDIITINNIRIDKYEWFKIKKIYENLVNFNYLIKNKNEANIYKYILKQYNKIQKCNPKIAKHNEHKVLNRCL